jgi:hypothetical protein
MRRLARLLATATWDWQQLAIGIAAYDCACALGGVRVDTTPSVAGERPPGLTVVGGGERGVVDGQVGGRVVTDREMRRESRPHRAR